MIKENYISLYDKFEKEGYETHDTITGAKKFLQYAADEGLIMDIAIIETKTKKMVWYNEWLGKELCKKRVVEFVKQITID